MINNKKQFVNLFVIAIAAVWAMSTGCIGASPAMPNPAAEKCIRDGFELKPIVENGVPVGYRCVDPRTGKSCEVWEYYRKQCDISAVAPSAPKKD